MAPLTRQAAPRRRPLWALATIWIAGVLCLVEIGSIAAIAAAHFVIGRPGALSPIFGNPYQSHATPSWSVYHPTRGYANRLWRSKDCGYSTDRYGFIHNGDPDRDFRRARLRIFVVGGSTVAGHGADCNDSTIPAVLERQLRESGVADVAVVNAGVAGYGASQELAFIIEDILRYQPTIVVSLTGTNDAHFALRGELRDDPAAPVGESAYYLVPYLRDVTRRHAALEQVGGALLQAGATVGETLTRTYTYYLVARLLAEAHQRRSVDDTAAPLVRETMKVYGEDISLKGSEGAKLLGELEAALAHPSELTATTQAALDGDAVAYARYVAITRSAVEGAGSRYLCVFQPHLALQTSLSPDERASLAVFEHTFVTRHHVSARRAFPYFKTAAEAALTANHAGCIDGTREFDGGHSRYFDPVHYTRAGNVQIADAIFRQLAAQGWLAERVVAGEPQPESAGDH